MYIKRERYLNVGHTETVDHYTDVSLDLKEFAKKYPDHYKILKKVVAEAEEEYLPSHKAATNLDTLDRIDLELNRDVDREDITFTYDMPNNDDSGFVWLCDRQYMEEHEPDDRIKLYVLFKDMALSTVAPRPAIYAHRFWSENDSSLFLQKKQCADFLGVDVFGYDYDLYEEVYDNHPVWAVLMENVRSGKINHVLVASSDRLSWSKDEIREVESELHKNNVRLTVVQDT